MSSRSSIVLTTIFEPAFLDGYLENVRVHGHEKETTIFIVPDRKTPASVYEAARDARQAGFDVRCPDFGEQESFLKKLGLPGDFIPWNTDNRRNVGYLMALDAGCEVLISIDDDNFCRADTDFVGEHVGNCGLRIADCGTRNAERGIRNAECADSGSGCEATWFNVCSMLQTDVSTEIYPRGFPYFARKAGTNPAVTESMADSAEHAAINLGLWLEDPDVDAVTRLSLAPTVTGFVPPSVILGPNTWSPVNTQNTALTREAATVYYYIRMGYPLEGLKIDRYGDILSGYFVQKCVKHLGHTVRVGTPIADHRRTPHNLFKDSYHELAGIVLVEELIPWLIDERLEGSTYVETYASLADRLMSASATFKGFVWDEGGRSFLAETAGLMNTWLAGMRRIG